MSEVQQDADEIRVQEAVNTLIEHFDSVQIFATRHDGSEYGTISVVNGQGNYFTRYGQVKRWVRKEECQ